MSVKQFFKGTAFKCIAVLLAIMLVCGILLTICNSLFYVTDQEKFDRVISKIYGKSVTTEEVDLSEVETSFDKGSINSAYKVTDDGNYLVNATGVGGFAGTVTCWVVVKIDNNAVGGIGNVIIESTQGETYINKIPSGAFNFYSENYVDGEAYDVSDIKNANLTGGATMSMTAVTNCVNTSIDFIKSQILGEEIAPNPYEGYSYIQYIDGYNTTHTLGDAGVVTYSITTTGLQAAGAFKLTVAVGSDKKVSSFKIDVNGSTSGYDAFMMPDILDGTYIVGKGADDFLAVLGENAGDTTLGNITTGATAQDHATKSNFLCLYAALFATANYDKAVASAAVDKLTYAKYIDVTATSWTAADGVVTYKVKTTSLQVAGAFELTVAVGSDKKVASFKIDVNGSTSGYDAFMMPDILDGTYIVGKGADDFLAVLGENADDTTLGNITTGATAQDHATKSNFLCLYAALFATANYDLISSLGGNA